MSPSARPRLLTGLVLGAILCAYLAFLGTRGLNEPDEGRYAELGREMAASGDWLIPRLNGFEHFQKPPLLYWATAASLKLCGVNEWGARLPSALAALGTAALTCAMGRRLLGKTGGLLAALVLLGSLGYFALSHLLTPDMLMTFWITAALACLVEEMHQPAASWRWGFFIAMGLGFLTKGPMALVVPACAALGATLAGRRSGHPLALPWGRGLLLALLIGLSWFLALSLLQPQLFTYFWKYELLQRFTSHAHGRSKPFWFFVPVILAGFLPWSIFLPQLARHAWQRLRQAAPLRPLHGLLLGWLLPPFLILSLSGSKLPTYPLPLFPGLSLLLVAWWQSRHRAPHTLTRLAAAALALGTLAAAAATSFNDHLHQQASVRSLVAALKQRPDFPQATLFAANVRAHGFEFYLGQTVAVTRDDADIVLPLAPPAAARVFEEIRDIEKAMSRQPVAYGLIRSGDFGKKFPPSRWDVLARTGDFSLIGKKSAPAAPTSP